MELEMKNMHSRKNVKVGHKLGWTWSRLIGKNHLNTGSSFLTNVDDDSTTLHVGNMEEPVRDAWLNLELSKAYAEKLQTRLV